MRTRLLRRASVGPLSRAPRRCLAALGAAITFSTFGVGFANADGLLVDGDGVTPLVSKSATITACRGMSSSTDVLIAARRNGEPNTNTNNNVFASSSTVTVGVQSTTAGLSANLADTSIGLESQWAGKATNYLSLDTVKATITLAPQNGPMGTMGTGSVTLSYSGVNAANGVVAGTTSATVNWTIAACDTTAPTLDLPASITAEATGPEGASVSFTATATDESAPLSPLVTCAPSSGSTFPLGMTAVQCSATDAAGNTADGSFSVTVVDTTPPAIVGSPSGIELEATGAGTLVSWTRPTATDLVSGSVPVTCTPPSGTSFAVGETAVECSAKDGVGNTATARFTVTINDTSAPALSLPDSLIAEATGSDGAAVTFAASAADLVDGPVAVTCTPGSGATFALGTTQVGCSATDSSGNPATGSFEVKVVDTTAPAVTVPMSLTAEAAGPDGADVEFAASADDAVSGSLTPRCTKAGGSIFPLGTTEVVCSATDAAGNTGSASFNVIVVDTTAPALTLPTTTVVEEATGPDGAIVTFVTSATDLVDGQVSVSCTPASGTRFALGSHQVNCLSSDGAGNTASGAVAVTVRDTTAPNITWSGGAADGASYIFGQVPPQPTCSATDLVSGDVTCTVMGYSGAVGSQTVIATATDAEGNTATSTRNYSVTAWTLKGFFQPTDMGNVLNTVKNGSTVPLKFEVFQGNVELTDKAVVAPFIVKGISCDNATADDVEFVTTGKTELRYDTTSGQFIQNWQTPKTPGACYQVTVTTSDSSLLKANFKLK